MPRNGADVTTRLRRELARKGISIGQLARDLGKDKSQVVKWVNGVHLPSGQNARDLARYFGKADDYFVTPRERRPSQAERLTALEAEMRELRRLLGHEGEM